MKGIRQQDMKKVLTIGIPAYNVEKYLEKCVDSIINSGHLKKIELIIVNDGSTDETLVIAEKYYNLYSEDIVIIDKENGGHGSGINCSIEKATGKYFKIIDGDDWVNSEELGKLVNQLEEIETDMVISPFKIVNVETKMETIVANDNLIDCSNNFDANIEEIKKIYQMHALTFKTSVLKQLDKKITEHCFYVDQEYILYPLALISDYKYIDACVYEYRIGRNDQSVNWNSMCKNRDMHKTVIIDLHNQKESQNMSLSKYNMYMQHIADMTRMQYMIYFHMPYSYQTYCELKRFSKLIKAYDKKEKRKISYYLSKYPWIYWICKPFIQLKIKDI